MSTEIMANKVNVDTLNKSVAVAARASNTQVRQDVAQAAGNTLPSGQVSAEELQSVVKQLNDHVQMINRDLQFSVDEQSGHSVVRVVNAETKELVRQMPSEEALRISRYIQEQTGDVSGLIFQTSV